MTQSLDRGMRSVVEPVDLRRTDVNSVPVLGIHTHCHYGDHHSDHYGDLS